MGNLTLESPEPVANIQTNAEPHRAESRLDPQFFGQVPHGLINDVAEGQLKPLDVVIYIILKEHVGQNRFAWVGNNRVARLCGASNATVRRSIRNLQRAGHIQRQTSDRESAARTYLCTRVTNGRSVYATPRHAGCGDARCEQVSQARVNQQPGAEHE